MSDQTQVDDSEEAPEIDELAVLKQRAKMMNIKFSNNISVEALRKKIEQKMEAVENTENTDEDGLGDPDFPNENPAVAKANAKLTLRQKIQAENMKLVRLRITNLDQKKKDLPGEIITVANEYLGTVRKFVPFGSATDNGYHVPWCIYEFLKSREFLSITTHRVPGTDRTVIKQRMVPEFALEVLPPLTKDELAKLAASQAAAGGVTD